MKKSFEQTNSDFAIIGKLFVLEMYNNNGLGKFCFCNIG